MGLTRNVPRRLFPSCRCRLRRFDLERPGFQQMFRRASESQILQQGRPAQNVHESLERKLSLPIIPNIGKLRANRAHLQPPPLPAVAAQQPMPKRLRTILEDSVGTFTPTSEDAPANVDASVLDPSDEYLVASIGLYLVSARLLVMLLCAFPEDGYQRVHGRPAAVAVASGTGLRSLWEHTGDKTAHPHAMSLLQGPLVPGTGPIRLELRLRPDSRGVSVGTQIILFRWGSLVFVCQQARGDSSTPEHSPAGAAGGEDSALQSYNIATPPRDESARGSMRPDRAVRPVRSANGVAGGWNQVRTSSPLSGGTPPDVRLFSLPRAPASMVANLPPRAHFMAPPPPPLSRVAADAAPPRRQSSHTLPPAKTVEERRFSFPTQS
ncbi:hypothetical protein H4R21_005662, partial [Coemansia helicoidea]